MVPQTIPVSLRCYLTRDGAELAATSAARRALVG